MQKGSLVQMKPDKNFKTGQILRAYELGVLLPRQGQIMTLSEDPIQGDCNCGDPECENGVMLKFVEVPDIMCGKGLFEEVQAPGEVSVVELFDSLSG